MFLRNAPIERLNGCRQVPYRENSLLSSGKAWVSEFRPAAPRITAASGTDVVYTESEMCFPFLDPLGCSWAVFTYLVSAPEPAVRWQTLQMLQVVHFLWPPFLFGALYRRGMKEVTAQFEAVAYNLPYYGD
jgi:hypothetical protein